MSPTSSRRGFFAFASSLGRSAAGQFLGDAFAQHGLNQRGRGGVLLPAARRRPRRPPRRTNARPAAVRGCGPPAVNCGSSMPRTCRKRRFGRPPAESGSGLRHDQIRFAAGHRPAVLANDQRQVLDLRKVADREIADDLVGGAVGEHDHVARLAGLFGEPVHPVDEGHHHDQQADDGGEGQRRSAP